MATAQILKLTHSIEDKVKVVDDKVTGAGNTIKDVDNKMKDMDDKMCIVLNGRPEPSSSQDPILIQTFVRREGCKICPSRHELSVINFSLCALTSLTCSQGTN